MSDVILMLQDGGLPYLLATFQVAGADCPAVRLMLSHWRAGVIVEHTGAGAASKAALDQAKRGAFERSLPSSDWLLADPWLDRWEPMRISATFVSRASNLWVILNQDRSRRDAPGGAPSWCAL